MERTARHKLESEVGIEPEPGFPAMSDVHYLRRLADLHRRLQPKVYFEIGTESGASLSFATCTSIAVDPKFRIEGDVIGGKPELHLYQGTSDAFFESGMLDRLGRPVDLAFLDGLHLFEALLRDFMNTERRMAPDGMVVLHDCVPFDHKVAERQWNRRLTRSWTGDVWKIVPVLREYRPDLQVVCRGYAPTGLVEITNLDPENAVLTEKFDEIVARFLPVTLEDYGVARFAADIDIAPAGPARLPARAKDARTIAIKTFVPNAGEAPHWGDHHFAEGLAAAFARLGQPARVDPVNRWKGQPSDDALDLLIQGHGDYPAGPERPSLNWLIYPGKGRNEAVLSDHAHVFVASDVYARKLRKRVAGLEPSVLPQAFDAGRMKPCADAPARPPVFVGNRHFRDRPMAGYLETTKLPAQIWGRGWERTAVRDLHVADVLPNEELGDVYSDCAAVLCDHTPAMARNGFLSNRVLDALACGAPVITDPVAGIDARFLPYIFVVASAEEFADAVSAIRAETPEMRAERRRFAHEIRATDSFDARAKTIMNTARILGLI